MRRLLWVVLSGVLVSAGGTTVYAQSYAAVEFGTQKSTFGNGDEASTKVFGLGFAKGLAGSVHKDWATLLQIAGDWRYDVGTFDQNKNDLNVFLDFAARVGNVSFGPGGSFVIADRGSLPDASCQQVIVNGRVINPIPAYSSCWAGSVVSGERDLAEFWGVGPSFFGKVNFGPQGRAFVQARYTKWLRAMSKLMTNQRSVQDSFKKNHGEDFAFVYPEIADTHELRLSAGYVLGGAGKRAFIIRGQLTRRNLGFENDSSFNPRGIFDQKTTQLTIGFGISSRPKTDNN